MEKIIVIVGPTAVGKTALSIQLSQWFNGEVISGDSMQIYQNLQIGTAKVTPEEMSGIPHYLVDTKKWEENYSAYDFKTEAQRAIDIITEKKHLPIIAGGTGLYIQSLLEGYSLGEKNRQTTVETENLWEQLQKIDPKLAATTHPNNERRILRALKRGTVEASKEENYDVFMIGLNTSRPILHERINQRIDKMMTQGLLKEAKDLYEFSKAHPNENYTVLQAIGYKEFFPYFKGEIELSQAVEQVKINSRRYAKRQITWFKNRMAVPFYNLVEHPEEILTIKKAITKWLKEDDEIIG